MPKNTSKISGNLRNPPPTFLATPLIAPLPSPRFPLKQSSAIQPSTKTSKPTLTRSKAEQTVSRSTKLNV